MPGGAVGGTLPAPRTDPTAYPGFLGRGWSFPPTFSAFAHRVDLAAGDADIRQAIWLILSTVPGERVMLPTFGCDLPSKVFTALTTTTANEIAMMVNRALLDWEPRITVNAVTVTDATISGWIDIAIDYTVSATNSRSNLVYPFCHLEATLPVQP